MVSRGERLVASVPHGHRKTSTFVGRLREGGTAAPCVLDGAVNGALFVAYIGQQVVPNLARGDVLIIKNRPVHKADGARQAPEAAGTAVRSLPAYSPDPNPIGMVFATMQTLLRKPAIRTVDARWRALGKLSQSLTQHECINYSRYCG